MTTTEEAPRSGFLRFWTSLPGVLTAAAAVITAIGGIYFTSGSTSVPISDPKPPVSTSATESAATTVLIHDPTAITVPTTDPTKLFVACDQGDLDACASLADIAEDECNLGLFDSCLLLDQLTSLGVR